MPAGAVAGEGARKAVGSDALREELAALPQAAGEVTLFSPDDHLPDVFLPLHREKRLGALVVVVPSENPLEEENLAVWKEYVASFSTRVDNLFVLREGALEGKVEGLPVRIVAVSGWKGIPGVGTLILDLSFLPALYRDEVRTPFVDLPRRFVATLESRGFDPSSLRTWVADRGRIPLARGYLPKLIAEIAGDPGAFRGDIPGKWSELRRGEYLAYFSAFDEAIPHFESYLKEEPEDPSVLFTMAQMHFVDRENERGLRFLQRAFRADPYYVRGYAEAALQFFRKGELETAERVLRAGLLQAPTTPDLKLGLAYVLLEQAVKMLPRDPAGAESRFSEVGTIGLDEESIAGVRARWADRKEGKGNSPPRPPEGMNPHGHGHMPGLQGAPPRVVPP